jgi:hypothetical protein
VWQAWTIPESTSGQPPNRVVRNVVSPGREPSTSSLTRDDAATIDALDTGVRGGPEPERIDTKLFTNTIPD